MEATTMRQAGKHPTRLGHYLCRECSKGKPLDGAAVGGQTIDVSWNSQKHEWRDLEKIAQLLSPIFRHPAGTWGLGVGGRFHECVDLTQSEN